MEYQCVDARFNFWNGLKQYTLQYSYALMTWYVFEGDKKQGALWSKKMTPKKSKMTVREEAEEILYEYLDALEPTDTQIERMNEQ